MTTCYESKSVVNSMQFYSTYGKFHRNEPIAETTEGTEFYVWTGCSI